MTKDVRAAVTTFWSVVAGGSDDELDEVLATHVDPAGAWHLSAPFDDVAAGALRPLLGGMRHALGLSEAQLDVAIATGPEGDRSTVAVMGYLHGTWRDRWLGFSHPGAPAALRFGSLHHVDGAGRIVESWVLLDVLDLADRAGVANCPGHYDRELVPGPARRDGGSTTRDGVASPEETAQSLALVDAMIQGLLSYDGSDLDSMGMERFWSADMAWYGPGAIGTGRTLRGFQDMHQRPFLAAFPDRTAGGEGDVAFFADGSYVFAGGWPNVTGTHGGTPYLGVPAAGGPVGMRVMDWWRREGDLLTENWVLIDMIDLFAQLGRPLIVDGELRPSGVRHG